MSNCWKRYYSLNGRNGKFEFVGVFGSWCDASDTLDWSDAYDEHDSVWLCSEEDLINMKSSIDRELFLSGWKGGGDYGD